MSELVSRAEDLAAGGRPEQSAVWLQIASTFGWFNHPGLFAHPRLESQLVALSDVVQDRVSQRGPSRGETHLAEARRGDGERRVMHVATQLYPSGGHTQMISQWVAEDTGSRSSLVLTRQGTGPVPTKVSSLMPSVRRGLDSRDRGLMTRALQLRRAAASADLVVIHAHPDDVVPAIALASSDIPCIVVNHADHVYWAGASVAKTALHMRHSGRELAERRRGLPADRGLLMNRPLEIADLQSRAEARRARGLTDSDVLVVTAAAGSKYIPVGGTDLVDLLTEVARRHPSVRVLAAGPSPEGAWKIAEEVTGGAVRALGRLDGVGALFAAGDIYVDSFPFSSLTSMLEAGTYAMPAVSFRGHPAECAVLGADSPTVDAAVLFPESEAEFLATVDALVVDEDRRRAKGRELQQVIEATHDLSWRSDLEHLYDFAASNRDRPSLDSLSADPHTGPLDLAVEQIQSRTGFGQGRDGALQKSLSLLPLGERVRAFGRMRRAGEAPRPSELVPSPWRSRINRIGRWARRSGA